MHFLWLDQVTLEIYYVLLAHTQMTIKFKQYHCPLVACQVVMKKILVGLGSVLQ